MQRASLLRSVAAAAVVMLAPAQAVGAPRQTAPVQAEQGIQAYVAPDGLETTRFQWLRGRFPSASEEERRQWEAIHDWAVDCAERRTLEVREDFRALGVEAAALPTSDYGQPACALVIAADMAAGHFTDWAEFSSALAEARGPFQGYRLATEAAEETARAFSSDMTSALTMLTVGEQTLRKGLGSNIDGSHPITLSDGARRLFNLLIWQEVTQRDLDNAALLSRFVEARGWPTVGMAGEKGSNAAWLLIQHADHNPVLQLRALRLMEPLFRTGEIDESNYAYLYDRVMLKISGKQRYGTQFTCHSGSRVPQPLEDPTNIDALRAEVHLGPLADYSATMNQRFGATCDG